ncbi:phage tail tape measure protein [Pseudomonas sp. RC10]|uniref:phage tail tape measure protein n=1 Tax=Pseudomonas bambusae TaxID=3139142 RepID=UPI003139AC2B
MALTSRLELEVDSAGAEQNVVKMRQALAELEAYGLRVNSALDKTSSEFGNLALSLSRAQAANDKTSASSDKVNKTVEDAAKAAAAQRKELDALLGSINPLTKQLNQLAAQEIALIKARDSGQINLAVYESYNQKLQENFNALTGATKAQKALGESVDEAKARILAIAQASVDSAQAQRNLTNTAVGLSEAEQGIVISSNAVAAGNSNIASSSDKAAAAVKQATQTTRAQADSLSDLLASIDPTTRALNRLDEQESQLARQKKIGSIDDETFNKYQTKIDQTRQALTRFDDGLNRTGNTAKQTAAALRGVPAQFTDIFVSLQGGQAPLTVFLQQGGQLKDMFGGIGPAVKALGGYILGLINPFTVAASAVGVLGLAYYQGSQEQTAFQSALVLTGNAAGTTSDNLTAVARNISKSVGTVGAASAVLVQLASSGKIPATAFGDIAVAALKMEEATGKAASATVADFEKLAKDPVKYSKELNDSLNYLTTAQYSQIDALVSQGKQQEAANLAEKLYADALSSRADAIKQNLGTVETAWNAVKSAAKNAWDAALDIGREDTFDQKLDKLKQRLADASNTTPIVFSDNPNLGDLGKGQKGLQKELTDTLQLYQDQTEAAWRANLAASKNQEGIEAVKRLNADLADTASKQSKLAARYKEIDALVASAASQGVNYSQAQIDQLRKAAEEQYKITTSHKAFVEDAGTKMLDQARQQYAVLQQQRLVIDGQANDTAKLGAAAQALAKWEQEIADIKGKQTLTNDQKALLASQDLITAQLKRNAALEKENDLSKIRLENVAKLAAFQDQLNDSLRLAQDGLDSQVAGVGMGQKERERIQEDLRIREDYQRQLAKLQRDYQNIVNPTSEQTDLYDKETTSVKNALQQRLTAQQNYYRQVDAAQADWVNGANAALQDYIDETRNVSGQTYTLFSDSLHGVEDAFVDAATTGKLSFKSLADSIIADLARIVAKAYIVTPILAALGIGGDSATGTGSGGAIGSIFSGSGSGIGGMLSSIKDVVSVAGSSFGQSVLAGWNGGEGVIGGLQGAFSNGADYFKSVVTSAFATGSATAASIFTSETTSAALSQGYANYAAQFGTGVAGQGAFDGALSSAVTSQSAASSLATLSSTLSYVGAVYSVIQSFQQYGLKGGATTAGFAAAGAAIGSVVPVIGTAFGAVIGAVVGSFASSKLFGSGEKYPDLSTSAQGTFENGQYTTGGIVQGWQTKAPKYGSAVDSQLDATVNKFTTTLGSLYTAFGSTAKVFAYDLLQVRKTSGKYSTTFGATIDGGGLDDLNIHQQFNAADAAEALQHNYDDIMGTFLAKAIVSSKSLPDYFRAQFTEFANDWDTTADEVIKAIEGVFTRFNGVNDALTLIGVNNLKLDNTGLQASDSILNMIGAMSDLDTTTATAKEKVDALNTAVGTYYSKFYTADEQFADLTKSLQSAFSGLGLELPDTRTAYRDMVKDIDVTTAAGQAMFATLVGLATNADSYYSTLDQKSKDAQQAAIDAAQKITDSLMKGASDAYSALQRSIASQQKTTTDAYNARVASLNDMLGTANTSVSDLTGVSNDLGSALKALRGDSEDAIAMLRSQAQATLQNALATAKAGGSLANFPGLDDALDTVSNNNTDLYSSLEEFNRDQGRTANVVAELNALNGKQLTTAEKTVKTLQDQLDQAKKAYDAEMAQYDAQLAYGQSQLDALNGVDNSILDVTAAINAMNAAVVAALGGLPSKGAGSGSSNTPGNNSTLVDTLYQQLFGRTPDAGENKYWADRLSSGNLPYSEIAANMLKYASEADKARAAALASGKVPAFANGGDFGGGIRLVGERGPEIELTGASRIISNRDAAKALASSGSQSDSGELAQRQAWTNKLLNQILNAINRQTIQGVPALSVT